MKLAAAKERVTIISVAYNSLKVLPRMLSSIPTRTPVIIVDNASVEIDELRALTKKHGAQLIENQSNSGFGAACNIGAGKAKTEFLLFLNPDAMLDKNALQTLVQAAENYPTASAMNPRIIGDNGKPFFKRKSQLLPRSKWMPRGWPNKDCEVTVLSGAAFFVRTKDFNTVNGFDEEMFLFHEDDDLAINLAKQCGPLMFIYDAVATHAGGSSSIRSAEIAALKAWHMGHSRVYAAQKHKVPFAKTIALSEATLNAFSPAILFSKRRRVKNWSFLKGVIHASLGRKSTERLK